MSDGNGHLTSYDELAEVVELLPKLIREARRARGLSLRAASEQIGCNFNTLTRFEQGQDLIFSNVVPMLRWLGTQEAGR